MVFYAFSIRFVGSVRTYSASHCIVESKRDTEGGLLLMALKGLDPGLR